MCSSTPDSFYSSCNGLIKMGHFRRFSCVRVRVRHVLDALIRALIGAQTMMMVVVACSLSFTFALSFSSISPYSLCLLLIVFCIMYLTPDSACLSPLRSPLAQPTQMRFAHLPLANSCEQVLLFLLLDFE